MIVTIGVQSYREKKLASMECIVGSGRRCGDTLSMMKRLQVVRARCNEKLRGS